MKKILLFISIVILFLGCAQKTTIKAIKASKIDNKSIKNIAVLKFANDQIGQSEQINTTMSNVQINNKKYFNLIERSDIDKIMAEKKLNDSGLVDLINEEPTAGLSQIQTLLMGKVNNFDISKNHHYEKRTDYTRCVSYKYSKKGKKYCNKYRQYSVSCRTNNYNLNTSIKIVEVKNSEIIFAKTYTASSKYSHCLDDNKILPSKKSEGTSLASEVANQIIKDIAPSYVYFKVRLFGEPDIYYDMKDKSLLKFSLELIKHKKFTQANKLLKKLVKNTNYKSYVALYNLAITYESLGKLEDAYISYKKADDISILQQNKIVEDISEALKRVKNNLSELNKAKKQQAL